MSAFVRWSPAAVSLLSAILGREANAADINHRTPPPRMPNGWIPKAPPLVGSRGKAPGGLQGRALTLRCLADRLATAKQWQDARAELLHANNEIIERQHDALHARHQGQFVQQACDRSI